MSALTNLPSSHPNHPSTVEEFRHGMAIIDKIDQDIETLENEIKNIRTKIYYLKLARANYAFQICPLRRLPIEILTEIVRLCIAQKDDIITIAGVCSRLREIVLGMTAIWSKISLQTSTRTRGNKGGMKRVHAPYGPGYYGDVRCTTLEQLELVLKRAGQTTLDLRVQWPPEPGTLELISSRKCPIHSLEVSVCEDSKTPFSTRRFLDLNVMPLKRVRISKVDWKKAKGLMDLALRSGCSEIALEMDKVLFLMNGLLSKNSLFQKSNHLVSLEIAGSSRCLISRT
ncbi:hypothetical protein CPB86DRAFT_195716 [Serendipita vermifera]|nr:hypothetical protein CPB86DRAFT_195716 [Serendipita vermifera]